MELTDEEKEVLKKKMSEDGLQEEEVEKSLEMYEKY